MRQVVNAAVNVAAQTPAMPEGNFVQFTVPVVVTGARIFECSLGESGEIEVIETSASTLYAQPDNSTNDSTLVNVLREDHLPAFVQELERSLDFMSIPPSPAPTGKSSAFGG